ncbi:SRPBCC family protein [Algoriphagus confluentis]|uniref:SRPBCC domain-containing protein n=1 Tax=Algoriphagus confluentis TaxID=1697556 RepID=A0ABQ6PVV1_9BACT|nr:hypothetical protein Aconfl_43520 [Algoriphagus confluentis]
MKSFLLSTSLYFVLYSGHTLAQTLSLDTWPPGFSPEEASFYVENQIEIAGSPHEVWKELIQAEAWSDWYYGATEVKLIGEDQVLALDSKFSWKTMGINFVSQVKEFEPHSRLSWISSKKSIQGFHIWQIIPTGNGCRVITAESQNGWLTVMEKIFQPKKLHRQHEDWLLLLKERVEKNQLVSQSTNPVYHESH